MAPNANEFDTSRGRPDPVPKRQSLQKGEWNGSFPPSFDTYNDSDKFMQRCFLLSMSQLLYARGLLPKTAFKKRNVTAIVRCQAPDTSDPIGSRLMEKLKGAGEAIHMGYMKEFMIVVGTNEADHDEAQEVFIWAMHYDDENNNGYAVLSNENGEALARMEYRGEAYVKEQTRFLLATIRKLCTQVLLPLPEKAFATFRITYTSKSPKGYQAPGFQRSPTLYDLHENARSVSLGGIATGHHKFILAVDSVFVEDEVVAKLTLDNNVAERSGFSDASFIQHNLIVDDQMENTRVEPVELSPPATKTVQPSSPEESSQRSVGSGSQRSSRSGRNISQRTKASEGSPQKKIVPKKRGRQAATKSQEEVSPPPVQKTMHDPVATPPSKLAPPLNKRLRGIYSGKMDEVTPGSSPGKRH